VGFSGGEKEGETLCWTFSFHFLTVAYVSVGFVLACCPLL